MPVLIQACVVTMTFAALAIVLMTARMMGRVNKASADLSQLANTVRSSAVQMDITTQEARELLTTVRDCVSPVIRTVSRLEAVGSRAADLSSTLLNEVALPVATAAAVARGVRSGAFQIARHLLNHFSSRPSLNGGVSHESP